MIEVEQKYRIDDIAGLLDRILLCGATQVGDVEHHEDTYFNHPSRDFAETKEAFRVRRINGVAWMTYKGTKLPGTVKARQEIEVRVGETEADGRDFESTLELLSFRRVATIHKQRRTFRIEELGQKAITIAVDKTADVGDYAEIEIVVEDAQAIDHARHRILALAKRLGLENVEQRSYLTMNLEKALSTGD